MCDRTARGRTAVVFTDLDGTLLEYDTYSFDKALPALSLLKELDIPLILCSSKTAREIDHYRRKILNTHPFITENGGGIYIPGNYFSFRFADPDYRLEKRDGYDVIVLGARYDDLRRALLGLRREGFDVRGFGDMTAQEIADATGLSREEAEMASERDFDEPFFFEGDTGRLFQSITAKGFHHTEGKIFHILGDSDKGRAVGILADLYRSQYGDIVTIGIGDSLNDLPMLRVVDRPVIVQKPDGMHDPRVEFPGLLKVDGIGPEGWNRAVLELMAILGHS